MTRSGSNVISLKLGMILVLLLGLDLEPPRLRTQAEVARLLKCSRASISQNKNKLVKLGLISLKPSKDRRCQYYSKGKKFALVSEHIGRYTEALNNLNEGSIPTGEQTKLSKLYYNMHLADGGMRFKVVKEGSIESIMLPKISTPVPFLGKPYFLRGNNSNRTGSVSHNNGLYKIRYQVTDRISQMYITPVFDMALNAETVQDPQKKVDYFLSLCSVMLNVLEKNGWKFAKDDCGRYLLEPLKDKSIHIVISGETGRNVAEMIGPDGVSGNGVWVDRSQGYPELETNNSDIIRYLSSLPEDQENTEKSLNQIRSDIIEIKSRLMEIEQWLDKINGYYGLDVGSKPCWKPKSNWAS